jgi:hypothetical protein
VVETKLFLYTFTVAVQASPDEYRPDWGRMSFLVDILRPTPGEGPSWYHLLKKASGGCNDLMYSGHMLVAVLTAMAWTVCATLSICPLVLETKLPFKGHQFVLICLLPFLTYYINHF